MTVLMKNQIVVKSNKLIEAGYKLTLQEQRILLFCIAQVDSKSNLHSEYMISVKDYADMFSISRRSAYSELKSVINALYNRSIKIYSEDKSIEFECRWLRNKLYVSQEGIAKITFSEDVSPLLGNLKSQFTSYNLKFVAEMKSSYAIRIYELIKQFSNIPTGERFVTLDWLKGRLEVSSEKSSYANFASFRKRVLEPAMMEINSHTDINLEYEAVKTGRKVTGINFTFSLKKKAIDSKASLSGINKESELVSVTVFIKEVNAVIDEICVENTFDRNKLSFVFNKFKANNGDRYHLSLLLKYIKKNAKHIHKISDIEEIVGRRLYLGYFNPIEEQKVTNPLSQSYYHEQQGFGQNSVNNPLAHAYEGNIFDAQDCKFVEGEYEDVET